MGFFKKKPEAQKPVAEKPSPVAQLEQINITLKNITHMTEKIEKTLEKYVEAELPRGEHEKLEFTMVYLGKLEGRLLKAKNDEDFADGTRYLGPNGQIIEVRHPNVHRGVKEMKFGQAEAVYDNIDKITKEVANLAAVAKEYETLLKQLEEAPICTKDLRREIEAVQPVLETWMKTGHFDKNLSLERASAEIKSLSSQLTKLTEMETATGK